MHQDDYLALDLILMLALPPQFGAAIGLLLGLARLRLERAALGGAAGGTVGAWAGLIVYRSMVLPNVTDAGSFRGCVLAGLLLGTIPAAWFLGGSRALAAKEEAGSPTPSSSVASLVCGSLGYLAALALAIVATSPTTDTTGVSFGLAMLCVGFPAATLCLLGVIFGVVALVTIRRTRCGGRAKAWAGIVLGCLPAACAVLLSWSRGADWLR